MPKTEILAYSPLDMADFIDFCVRGRRLPSGAPATDEDGDFIFGVFSWLHGWRVREAQFFHTPIPPNTPNPSETHPMQLFLALVQKREGDDVERPWFKNIEATPPQITVEADIPGIDKVLRIDGELGMLDEFVPFSDLLATIQPDPDLDAEFRAQGERVLDALERLKEHRDAQERFLAALRGEAKSEPINVFKELEFSLRD